ncbi:MAG TPA: allantoinase AllB [Pirellulales bacterium]|nr:allantoinase AllB [Pirellulales bacterium]
MRYDCIVRIGMLVRAPKLVRADIGIVDGRIVAIEPELTGSAREEIDASGLHVLPGVIDCHVHFNEPGRTDWEGAATGSTALAAGGGTTFFDMPLNSSPTTVDAEAFRLKREALELASHVDFGLWGGLVPGNVKRLDELAECGAVGFKAFMCDSGIADFVAADDYTLWRGMQAAAALGLPVAVHAENDVICRGLAREAITAGRRGVRDYLNSRPVVAEVEAIARVIELAADAGCSLHIVHVSSGRGVATVAAARARGIDVTCETCPHYLVLTDEDVERIGAAAKCSPPIRGPADRDALWQGIEHGDIAFVASDHSPAPHSMKQSENFFEIWGGIAGCQTMLGVMLEEGYGRRGIPLERIAELLSSAVARRFHIPDKGKIEVGNDADLALVDLSTSTTLKRDDLRYRHCVSPYLGRRLGGIVRRTIVRGRTVLCDGAIVGTAAGRLVRPIGAKR